MKEKSRIGYVIFEAAMGLAIWDLRGVNFGLAVILQQVQVQKGLQLSLRSDL